MKVFFILLILALVKCKASPNYIETCYESYSAKIESKDLRDKSL